jgi:predicted DNA-binding transcriptional regulator YafY
VNRTDRLYALVEELRAVAPRPRSARWLAERFEVSGRTIERDLSALQQAGVPIWAEPGRSGGYAIDATMTLAPLGLTEDEALVVAIALAGMERSPFAETARSARRKVVAVMGSSEAARAADLAARVHLLEDDEAVPAEAVPGFSTAVARGRVVRIEYVDRSGAPTVRHVEPLGYVGKSGDWFLIGWCRLRDGVRAFRADRIRSIESTGERAPHRPFGADDLAIRYGELRAVRLD